MATRILIYSISIGADYLFELISIIHRTPKFIGRNKIFLGSVKGHSAVGRTWNKLVEAVLQILHW